MPNPIKYSTGSESLALKKGNFYIGTGDVDKGPTSSTGYYNGITPPSGGYTIYLNKASGGPSIYTASNDAQLISLTNSIASQSYTTVNECLAYYAGQTDKMVLNRDYEGIVTDGLVLNLDAGFTPSYPKNGTTWYDVGGTNNGTLTNGPTFSTDGNGCINFDGTNDYIALPSTSIFNLNNQAFTVNLWFKIDNFGTEWDPIFTKGDDCWRIQRWGNNATPNYLNFATNSNGPTHNLNTTFALSTGQWYNITCVHSITAKYIYSNGTLNISQTGVTGTVNTGAYTARIGGNSQRTTRYLNGQIAIVQLYHRALSATEILQNYNATKGRFGL